MLDTTFKFVVVAKDKEEAEEKLENGIFYQGIFDDSNLR